MPLNDLRDRAFEAFEADVRAVPPLTLRGGCAVDGYDRPEPFDPARDEPTDTYLEQFTFWGLNYLDAASWRHYLPCLIDYACRQPSDPAMVIEALVRSLRPPDRYPSRLRSLSTAQEAAVTSLLEHLALGDVVTHVREEAQQALEEWWLPQPRSRPTPEEVARARELPTEFRRHTGAGYALDLPAHFTGSGVREVPAESRLVETFGGYLHFDAHTVIAINVSPIAVRSLVESVRLRSTLFTGPATESPFNVAGAREAVRLAGAVDGNGPGEPQRLTFVIAATDTDVITLSIRAWPREDVSDDVEHVLRSLEVPAL